MDFEHGALGHAGPGLNTMTGILLRGATVITMSPSRSDAERVDILIEDGRISDIGEPDAPYAETVDLSGRIVIPGLVNAHLHTWQGALRHVGADWTLLEYLQRMHADIAPYYTPDDVYIGNLAGALNQISCGTTTLGDWCHNNATPEHTDAAVEALQRSGIRAVFLHGTPNRDSDAAHPLEEIDRLLEGPTYAIAGADGLFIAKEIGGDAVDLLELFELHAQALYDTALRLIAEGTGQ
ncbi:MAG: amidohydrolase family protein [Mycobacterium sp.]|uniref:amidohydrolase family protein n=1 Tax=Mycobacterium sp. TaxID=1785 RepID=UPI003C478FA8